jgi:hypothetical protein
MVIPSLQNHDYQPSMSVGGLGRQWRFMGIRERCKARHQFPFPSHAAGLRSDHNSRSHPWSFVVWNTGTARWRC